MIVDVIFQKKLATPKPSPSGPSTLFPCLGVRIIDLWNFKFNGFDLGVFLLTCDSCSESCFFFETWGWNFPNKTLHETYKMEKAFQAIFTSQIKSLQTKGVWGISTCCFVCQTKRSLKSSRAPNIWISIWSCLKIWIPQDPGQLSIPQRKYDRFWMLLPSDQHILKRFRDENLWHHCHYLDHFLGLQESSRQTNPWATTLSLQHSDWTPSSTRNIFSGWISAAGSDDWTRDMPPFFLMEQMITFRGKLTADLNSQSVHFQFLVLTGLTMEGLSLPPKIPVTTGSP